MSIIRRSITGLAKSLMRVTPSGRAWLETQATQTPISAGTWFSQKILGTNRAAYWPVHPTSLVQYPERIVIGIETSPGLMPGCYIQGTGGITIGDYTQIAPNVGIISSNHDPYDNRGSKPAPVHIGAYCWIGMAAIILPGVTLGDFTIVGAGAIVTKSFPDGYCVIAGNPAKLIKPLDRERCVRHRSRFEYNGYIPSHRFADFLRRNDIGLPAHPVNDAAHGSSLEPTRGA